MKKKANQAGTAPAETPFSLIPNETLIALYADLFKCRMLEERVNGKSARKKPAATLRGFEAAPVGVAKDLTPEDCVVCSPHDLLPRFLHDRSLKRVLGKSRAHGKQSTDATAERLAAIGAALSHKTTKSGKVVVMFRPAGDLDGWQQAQQIAKKHMLPMIFVCQESQESRRNDNAAARNGRSARNSQSSATTDEGYLPLIAADSADVVAVYRVAHEAIERARRGRGPTLIECAPFRVPGQRRVDPVANMQKYLRGKGLLKRGLNREIADTFMREVEAAHKPARKPGAKNPLK